jgi:GNAT superfamily N-acetyltransferase
MEIRALRESDDRTGFCSGEPDLDRFLQKYAGQNQFRHHIGTTYVAVGDAARVLGYATVAAGSLEVQDLPPGVRKGLPQYPLPILRLARLAVDERVRGQGIGKALLRFVLDLALRMAEEFGCTGVAVDAKPGAVEFYEAHGFIRLEVISGQSGARPMPVLMFLSTKEIQAARGKRLH